VSLSGVGSVDQRCLISIAVGFNSLTPDK
jgi:hypothetical protein